jgi:glycosyltransferase involved in cell wall biosynthesis
MTGDRAVSAFVITLNEERNIADCLESLKWADEIVVVDSGSTDATVGIARRYTGRVLEHPFEGYVPQTRWAAEQTRHPWILWLDADERLSAEARREIEEVLADPDAGRWAGLEFPRRNHLGDRWIRHAGWYPQYRLRMWRRDAGRFDEGMLVPRVLVSGSVRRMKGDILHYSYPNGVADMMQATARYAAAGAAERHAAGRRFSLLALLLKPPFTFLKKWLLQAGFLDGLPGLAVAAGAAYHRFVREVMLWEMEQE